MVPALRLPSDSEGEEAGPSAAEVRPAWGDLALRRVALLGLAALALVGCGLAVALAHRSPQPLPPRLRATPGRPPLLSGAEEEGGLAALLLADSSEDEGLAAALLVEGEQEVGAEEHLEGLLEDDAEEHDHDSVGEPAEHLAESLQQKYALQKKPKKALRKVFHEADLDHSGVIEGSELQALGGALAAYFRLAPAMYDQLYAQTGRSKDGQMDFKELRYFAAVLYIFGLADEDHNDLLSGEELSVEGFALAKRLAWAHLGPEVFERLLREADANGDERFSPAEMRQFFVAAHAYMLPRPLFRLFQRLDADRSDSLEGAELDTLSTVLQRRFRLSPAYVEASLSQAKLDRRDFKELLWKAWDGSPFKFVGPWRMIKLFHRADRDKNSFVEGKEVTAVTGLLQKVFWVDGPQLQALMKSADSDADHRLSPRGFAQLMLGAKELSPFAKMCIRSVHLFKMLDRNGDHLVDWPELKSMAQRMQHRFGASEELYSKAVASADADGDAKLSPQEFRQLLAVLHGKRVAPTSGPLLRPVSV